MEEIAKSYFFISDLASRGRKNIVNFICDKNNRPVIILLAVSFLLNSFGIWWGLPSTYSWAIDSIAPYRVLEGASKMFSNGWYDTYPPFHFILLSCVYAPILGYLFLTGKFQTPGDTFPFGLKDPLTSFTILILMARVISVLMGTSIVLLIYLITREVFDKRAAFFSAACATFCYPLVFYSHTSNVDVPYLCYSMLALYFFVKIIKYQNLRSYILFGIFSILAICTKDQALNLFLLSPLLLLWFHYKAIKKKESSRPNFLKIVADKKILYWMLTSIIVFIVSQNIVFNYSGFVLHIKQIISLGYNPYPFFPHTFTGQIKLFVLTFRLIKDTLGVLLFIVCLIAAIYSIIKHPRYSLSLLMLALSYYMSFLSVISWAALRLVLPLTLILTIFAGKLIADFWIALRNFRLLRAVGVSIIFFMPVAQSINLDLLLLNDSRYRAQNWMKRNVKNGEIIEFFAGGETYLPNFPRWSKVRRSFFKGGTVTMFQPRIDYKAKIPDDYRGPGKADYLVLSRFIFHRYTKNVKYADNLELLNLLFQGKLGYEKVAEFKSPNFLIPEARVRGLKVNPKILIFKKSE